MTSVRHICHFCWDHQTSLPQQLGTLPPLALPSNLGTAYALSWHYHPLCTLLPLQLEPLKYWNASKLCEEVDESVCLHFDVKLIQLQATERENPIHAGLSHKSIYSYHVTRSPNALSSRLGTQIHSTIKHPISFSLDFVILICQLFILRHATPCSQDNCHKSKQYIFIQHQLGKTVGRVFPRGPSADFSFHSMSRTRYIHGHPGSREHWKRETRLKGMRSPFMTKTHRDFNP